MYEQSANEDVGVYLLNQMLRKMLVKKWEEYKSQQIKIKKLLNKNEIL